MDADTASPSARSARIVPRGVYRIELTRALCKACGLCVAWCPQQVLESDEFGYPVAARTSACVDCKACERHCPDFAIEVIALRSE
jgi:2-oxoglutarate ferredoxin oxidoreductase subunit delta